MHGVRGGGYLSYSFRFHTHRAFLLLPFSTSPLSLNPEQFVVITIGHLAAFVLYSVAAIRPALWHELDYFIKQRDTSAPL